MQAMREAQLLLSDTPSAFTGKAPTWLEDDEVGLYKIKTNTVLEIVGEYVVTSFSNSWVEVAGDRHYFSNSNVTPTSVELRTRNSNGVRLVIASMSDPIFKELRVSASKSKHAEKVDRLRKARTKVHDSYKRWDANPSQDNAELIEEALAVWSQRSEEALKSRYAHQAVTES